MHERFAAALTIGAIAWLAVLLAAPAAVTSGSFTGPAAAVYVASSRICHQRPERSFHVAGVQLPVCARCFGLYAAGAFGVLLAWAAGGRPGSRARLVLAASAVPTAATWLLEAAGFSIFSNATRAVAALPLGAAAGWLFVQLLRYDAVLNGHEIDHRGSRVRSC
jgi:uncharacterized membrane protein